MELVRKYVYVGDLPAGIQEDDLKAAFIPFGEISSIVMPPDLSKVKSNKKGQNQAPLQMNIARNFALIDFEDVEDAEHAIFNMNDSEFFGKVISVHWAKNSQKQALLGGK